MAKYPEYNGPLPPIYGPDDHRQWEEAIQQAAVANALISACERVGMPVQELRANLDAATEFLHGLKAEFLGPQSPNPQPMG